MRVEFVRALEGALAREKDSLLLTGDLGFNAFEGLARDLGPRFVNMGVAEQNMIGVAAGLALSGLKPWVYSIAPFVTLRCLEQIRNDVSLHNLPVRLVGNGGGYTYGIMGSTHHALEDLGSLKSLPNLRLFFPCAGDALPACVSMIEKLNQPSYLRLGMSGFPSQAPELEENPVTLTRRYAEGDQATVVAMGHAAQIALTALAAGLLDSRRVSVFGMQRFPFDLASDAALSASLARSGRLVLIEEHYEAGGLSESLTCAAAQAGIPFRSVTVLAARHSNSQRYGSQKFHIAQSQMAPDDLACAVTQALKQREDGR